MPRYIYRYTSFYTPFYTQLLQIHLDLISIYTFIPPNIVYFCMFQVVHITYLISIEFHSNNAIVIDVPYAFKNKRTNHQHIV